MLNPNQLRKLIVDRLFKLQGCKDRNYLWHHIGVIRGLIWALTGKDHGDLSNTDDILEAIDVPYDKDPMNGQVIIPQTWLDEHKIKG